MKGKLLCLFVLSIFTVNLAYTQYVEDTLTINRTEDAPYIDGYIDWEWDLEEYTTIDFWGYDSLENPHAPKVSDFVAKFKMLWDDENIYFLGVTEDDFVADMSAISDAAAQDWETDSWEIYIAPTLTKLEDMTELTQIRFAYANASSENATSGVDNGWSQGGFTLAPFASAAREYSEEGDGWVLEAQFTLAAFADAVEDIDTYAAGDIIGWQITACDNNGGATRDWVGSWIPDTEWNQADTLGILKLGQYLTGEVPADTTETTGFDNVYEEAKIRFFPNPVIEELGISANVEIESIEIINSLGSMVLRSQDVNRIVDVSELQSGIYFAKVYSKGKLLQTRKFIKK